MTINNLVATNSQQNILSELVAQELIDNQQRDTVTHSMGELNLDVLTTLTRSGFIADDALYHAAATCLNVPLVSRISDCPTSQRIIEGCKTYKLDLDWCVNHSLFVTTSSSNETEQVTIYTDKPFNASHFHALALVLENVHCELALLTPAMAMAIIDDIQRERAVSELFGQNTTDIAALAEEAPVINLVNSILERAIFSEASDIHIEPGSKNMAVRFRIDGKLTEFMQQPISRFQAIASRIKLLSELDIAERRLPQDGRFTTRASKREYDVRVSTAPDVHGESIVMRLLPKQRDELSIEGLGFAPDHLEMIRKWGKLSNGIVLVTGPTGSGKSTTLYALLADVKSGDEKIVTVEDPVEYQLEGITQVQAKPEIGYTFARALRSFLRQDPDIIMVGEIRDKETADIAIQSSLTGHLVLSTLHTNDACAVFPRLADIGVETYLTAATVQGVQAQRLVRKLCSQCAEPAPQPSFLGAEGDMAEALKDIENPQWKTAVGCSACHGRGYRGRIGIYELVSVTPEIRQLVASQAPISEIRAVARKAGFRSLQADGLRKAAQGLTTVDEILRVCSSNEDS